MFNTPKTKVIEALTNSLDTLSKQGAHMPNSAAQIEKTRIDLLVVAGLYDKTMEDRYQQVQQLEERAKALKAEIEARERMIKQMSGAIPIKMFDAMVRVEPYLHDLQKENINDPSVGLFPDLELNAAFEQFTEAIEAARETFGA